MILRHSRMIFALALAVTTMCLPALAQDNPLLAPYTTPFQTPPFDKIQNAHFVPAIQEAIKRHDAEIEAIVNYASPATFENTVVAIDMAGELLSNVTGVFFSLMGTISSEEMQNIAKEISPLLSTHNDNIWLNEKLFARVRSVYDKRSNLKLNAEQLYLLENMYRDFVRRGALLNEEQKARLREINQQSSMAGLEFRNNNLSETNDSYIVIDDTADLAGLPDNIVAMGADDAKAKNLNGKWVFTAQRPSWTPFLQYAQNRKLRQQLYTAYFMHCDRDNEHDNKQVVQKIMTLREERCRLLGHRIPATFYLEDRMAKSPEVVDSFLWKLWRPALNRAKTELAEMQGIADRENAGFKLQCWDWWYYAEKLRKEKYDLDDASLRPYFSTANVEKGIFLLAEKLYGLKFVERKDIPIYHPEVKVHEVHEGNGKLVGILYTDFFPRESKGSGAWSGSFRSSFTRDGKRVIPLATVVCNSSKPTATMPSLLSIDEAKTVFHEFGHALNTLLSTASYRSDYGQQDAVELPSQIMENWVLEPEFLKLYARHYKTGEIIPLEMVERIKNSYLFNKGFETVEYLAACFLDMAWHELESAKDVNVMNFEAKAMADIGLIPEILPRYHTVYFGHMMGGYSAGYYSYIWAGVLDADAFEAFKETSLFDKKTATSFRKNILERLGTEDSMTLYKRFRGREPKVEPLLEKDGLL